jgi:hypothetical protein
VHPAGKGGPVSLDLCLEAPRAFVYTESARSTKITVSAGSRDLVPQAEAVLLWEALRVTGLGRGLAAALDR